MPERDSYGHLGGLLEVEDHEYMDAWRKRYVLLDETSLKFYHGKEAMQVTKKAWFGFRLESYVVETTY